MTFAYVFLAIVLSQILAWAYFTAQRLNRLHIRVDLALHSLGAALDRRAALAQALVAPAADAAVAAQSVPVTPENFDERAQRERVLWEKLSGVEHPLLIDATARVELAHRFYNEAVSATRSLRTRPMVQFCHLGGTARLPEYFELRYT
ncbi:hypothetical protein QVA66_01080 [Staphylococcus chromogenes]|nr:hypothetical protein [Staphylococcus chromogenes]